MNEAKGAAAPFAFWLMEPGCARGPWLATTDPEAVTCHGRSATTPARNMTWIVSLISR